MTSRLPALLVLLLAPVLSGGAAAQESIRSLTLDLVLDQPAAALPQLPRLDWVSGTHLLATVAPEGETVVAMTRDGLRSGWQRRFDAGELVAALTAAGAANVSAGPMPQFTWLDAETVRVVRPDGVFQWSVGAAEAARTLVPPPDATTSAIAPGDRIGAFVTDHDLHIVRADGRRRRITWDGSEDIVYGGAAHRAEFGIQDGLWWDAGGRRLAFSREDQRPITPYPYADYTQQPPVSRHGRYPMAGDEDSQVTIGVYDSAEDSVRFLEADAAQDLYWTNVTFTPDGKHVLVALVSRGQDRMELVRFDCATGKRQAVLFAEGDPEWIEPEHGPIFTPDGSGQFLWFSPRDGYRHLYRYDSDGKLLGPATQGRFDVRSHLGFDADGHALVMGSGDDPLQMHLWRADPSTGTMTALTTARGWHECQPCSDGSLVLDRYSNLELPGALDLVTTRTGEAVRLATAADPLAAVGAGQRRFFEVEASDGTPLHGVLLLPPDPAPDRKHPVLQYVYGGPHSQLVRDVWLGGANLWLHYMASRGFVVFVLDNRGTDNRGIEFSQAVFRRLGTLEVEDQIRALEHVCALPLADPTRVGVHGWSYGGFMTLSLMTRAPERYTCGVGGAPVTDWAQYETGYTERYMDTPDENPDGYRTASVVNRAADLKGRLMVVQGTDDRTVMLSQSMRFLDACIDAGTLVELMTYPMQLHGLRGADRKHLYRTMTRFFEERLVR